MILLVDDKKENLFSLKALLELHRFEVDLANSGEEALRKVLKTSYALIILDVQMPGMDGYEVAEIVTGYSKTKAIPIIFLSAVNIDHRFISKGYASGAVDYITKPFDPDLLLLKVQTFHRLYEQNRQLNQMQVTLKDEIRVRQEAEKALQESNLKLEDKVRERTSELVAINRELEASNVELQQYAYVASHDLQEPLRKIITFSHLLHERFLSQVPDASVYIDKVIASTERMRTLIYDLLNYSKLSVSAYFSQTNLDEVVRDSVNDLEIRISEKSATLDINPLPVIEANPGQVRQMFQNIVNNALKFSRPGVAPHIRIWSELVESLNIHSNVAEHGPYLRICIADNGIGFNEKYVDKIFTLFQRLHSREQFEGTGIGLAIVKKIIEKHNGLLSATSVEGQGTTFIIILPVKQQAVPVKA